MSLLLWGCTTETVSYQSVFEVPPAPPIKIVDKTTATIKTKKPGIMTKLKMAATTTSNRTKDIAKGIGSGIGTVGKELWRPMESMREKLINAYGVEEKE